MGSTVMGTKFTRASRGNEGRAVLFLIGLLLALAGAVGVVGTGSGFAGSASCSGLAVSRGVDVGAAAMSSAGSSVASVARYAAPTPRPIANTTPISYEQLPHLLRRADFHCCIDQRVFQETILPEGRKVHSHLGLPRSS